MSRYRIPQFLTLASRGMWLLGLVLGSGLSLTAQQPAVANTQSRSGLLATRAADHTKVKQGNNPHVHWLRDERINLLSRHRHQPWSAYDWRKIQTICESKYFSALRCRGCLHRRH